MATSLHSTPDQDEARVSPMERLANWGPLVKVASLPLAKETWSPSARLSALNIRRSKGAGRAASKPPFGGKKSWSEASEQLQNNPKLYGPRKKKSGAPITYSRSTTESGQPRHTLTLHIPQADKALVNPSPSDRALTVPSRSDRAIVGPSRADSAVLARTPKRYKNISAPLEGEAPAQSIVRKPGRKWINSHGIRLDPSEKPSNLRAIQALILEKYPEKGGQYFQDLIQKPKGERILYLAAHKIAKEKKALRASLGLAHTIQGDANHYQNLHSAWQKRLKGIQKAQDLRAKPMGWTTQVPATLQMIRYLGSNNE